MGTGLKTVTQLIARGEQLLQEISPDSARWEAETLLRHAAGWSRIHLYQNLLETLQTDIEVCYEELLSLRMRR
jgi:hypothetical protein